MAGAQQLDGGVTAVEEKPLVPRLGDGHVLREQRAQLVLRQRRVLLLEPPLDAVDAVRDRRDASLVRRVEDLHAERRRRAGVRLLGQQHLVAVADGLEPKVAERRHRLLIRLRRVAEVELRLSEQEAAHEAGDGARREDERRAPRHGGQCGGVVAVAVREQDAARLQRLDVDARVEHEPELRQKVGRGVCGAAEADDGQLAPDLDAAQGVVVARDADVPLRRSLGLGDRSALRRRQQLQAPRERAERLRKGVGRGVLRPLHRLEEAGQLSERDASITIQVGKLQQL
mmetsp:Transcript_5409/g.16206  ORF Transcript_5409/g.16206 Transcript_5409/m.16206 type:complete len:286 (+) Transcript_5409:368-1225(+)